MNPTGGALDLEELRAHLDGIDDELLRLVGARIETVLRIAQYKKIHAVPMMQPHRIRRAHERAQRFAAANALSADFLSDLYDLLIAEACRVEDEAMGNVPES